MNYKSVVCNLRVDVLSGDNINWEMIINTQVSHLE